MNQNSNLTSLYCGFLEEIRVRLGLVRGVCTGTVSAGSERFDYEIASVNLRKVLELIAFGSLTANKEAYAATHANFERHWKAKLLLESLEKIHPDFYPTPLIQPTINEGEPRHLHFDKVTDGYLTRDDFVELYDFCSKVIHSQNPFAPKVGIDFRMPVIEWVGRIETLLRFHLFRLVGLPQIWIGELCAPGDGKAHVYVAHPT